MQVVLIVAQSLDGFITRHGEPGAGWASAADQKWFQSQLTRFDGRIMASTTYETVRRELRRRAGQDGKRHLVMTREPERYADDRVAGWLEFSDAPAPELLKKLTDTGATACALLGGATAHDAFLGAGLVDEIRVTIEPRLFGHGTPVVRVAQDQRLRLIDVQRLPESDSLVVRYQTRP